jgi:hypothetical protein
MKGIGYFQNLRNFLRNILDYFWNFWRNLFGGIFWEKFFGRIFWEDFFGKIFMEDFLGEILWEELLSRN